MSKTKTKAAEPKPITITISDDDRKKLWHAQTFFRVYYLNVGNHNPKEVYEAIEEEHERLFKRRKYSDYQSFRQMRVRYVKQSASAS